MTKFKGTTGEWTLRTSTKGHSMISGDNWDDFCKVYKITEKPQHEDPDNLIMHEANAILIAHAKNMFELLELFISENMLSHKGEELAEKMIEFATTYPLN
jgi:hypothetical protein